MTGNTTSSIVIYKSVHRGNTKKVAEAISDELECRAVDASKLDSKELEDYDLIGFGSGVYYRKHHSSLVEFIDEAPDSTGKKAFIFSTSGFRKIPVLHDFSKKTKKKLRESGFNLIGEFSCRGAEDYGLFKWIPVNRGRPNKRDLKKARKFAEKMRRRA